MINNIQNTTTKDQQKNIIIESLQSHNFESVEKQTYFGNRISGKNASQLLQTLYFDFQEEDPTTQEYYFRIMDKLIDGLLPLYYDRTKTYLQFKSIDHIHNVLLRNFQIKDPSQRKMDLQIIINKIIAATNKTNSRSFYQDQIQELFQMYQVNKKLDFKTTSNFYNSILNDQTSYFFSRQKKLIIEELTQKLPYTTKKQKSAIISTKLTKLNILLAKGDYDKLNTNKQQLQADLNQLHEVIKAYKELRKGKYLITENQFQELDQLFLHGLLNTENIAECLNSQDSQLIKMILNKYSQIGIKLLDQITITTNEIKKINLGYNYNNYLIANREQYYNNLADLILNITPKKAEEILMNSQSIQEISFLSPLVNLIPEFDTKIFESILRKYPQIKSDILNNKHLSFMTTDILMHNFNTVLRRAEAYTNASPVVIDALGTSVIETILKKGALNIEIISTNPQDYLEFYIKMLQNQSLTIPSISGEFDNYTYQIGNNSDVEKLIIGKRCPISCMGPKSSGTEAYNQCLTGKNADIIMIKNKNTGNFIGRALIFRKGNFAIIAPFYDEVAEAKRYYTEEFLTPLADQILANAQNDNLEHILIAYTSNTEDQLEKAYPLLKNRMFIDCFPHADLSEYAYLIKSKNNNLEINANEPEKGKYLTIRQPVKDQNITKEELSQIKALSILMIADPYKRLSAQENYQPISPENYHQVYKGQDWYLAINDKQIDLVMLPTNDPRQKEEIENIQKTLKADHPYQSSIITAKMATTTSQRIIQKKLLKIPHHINKIIKP